MMQCVPTVCIGIRLYSFDNLSLPFTALFCSTRSEAALRIDMEVFALSMRPI